MEATRKGEMVAPNEQGTRVNLKGQLSVRKLFESRTYCGWYLYIYIFLNERQGHPTYIMEQSLMELNTASKI